MHCVLSLAHSVCCPVSVLLPSKEQHNLKQFASTNLLSCLGSRSSCSPAVPPPPHPTPRARVPVSAGVLLVACGSDPFHLVDAGVAAAAALSGGAAPRSIKQLPTSLDGFGW